MRAALKPVNRKNVRARQRTIGTRVIENRGSVEFRGSRGGGKERRVSSVEGQGSSQPVARIDQINDVFSALHERSPPRAGPRQLVSRHLPLALNARHSTLLTQCPMMWASPI